MFAVWATVSVDKTCQALSCSDQEFRCDFHSKCILKEQLCDGKRDCPTGEDELIDKKGDECNSTKGWNLCQYCGTDFKRLDWARCGQKCRLSDSFYCANWDFSGKSPKNIPWDRTGLSCQFYAKSSSDFRCDNGAYIGKAKLCDGNMDCIHGEDEEQSDCLNYRNFDRCRFCSNHTDYNRPDWVKDRKCCAYAPNSNEPGKCFGFCFSFNSGIKGNKSGAVSVSAGSSGTIMVTMVVMMMTNLFNHLN